MIKGIIFDVDGTLVDSVDSHAKAWCEAFAAFGHEVEFERVRSQIGKGGDQLLPVFLDEAEVEDRGEAIDGRRAEIFKSRYMDQVQGFPKVRELFERLRGDDLTIALASSAKGDELREYKGKAGIEGLVEEETSSDDAERSKPYGDIFQAALDRLEPLTPDEVIVVGDTPWDAEAAAKVGIKTIGVLCGGFAEADLREAGCVAIFRDPADMLARYDELPLA